MLWLQAEPDERSPILLQFLDCVHQLRHQQPEAFEFSDAFLVELTRRGGTFSPRWRIVLRTLFAAAFCRCECSAGRRAACSAAASF